MEVVHWVKVLEQVGPLAAIIVFFVWRDYKREVLQSERLKSLEQYQQKVLEGLVSQTTKALTQSTECIRWLSIIVTRLMHVCPKLNENEIISCNKPEGLK
jgi:hypothetical protein